MKVRTSPNAAETRIELHSLIFPGSIISIYGILTVFNYDKAAEALSSSMGLLLTLLLPLSLVFILIFLMNLFLSPAHVAGFLGKKSGAGGLTLAALAGIISTGPIYAWYPLLTELKKKGAANSPVAVFLGNRAVKPFLLPVMIAYFGWEYVALLTLFTIAGSIAAGHIVGVLVPDST